MDQNLTSDIISNMSLSLASLIWLLVIVFFALNDKIMFASKDIWWFGHDCGKVFANALSSPLSYTKPLIYRYVSENARYNVISYLEYSWCKEIISFDCFKLYGSVYNAYHDL